MDIWESTLEVLNAPITEIDGNTLTPVSAIQIAILLIITFIAAGRIRGFTRYLLVRRMEVGERQANVVSRAVGFLSIFVGVYVALTSVGFDLNVLVAIIGGLSVGVAFGTQDIARNVISGVIVSAEKRIRPGERVEIKGFNGIVEDIGPRSIRLRLDDGRRVVIASSDFMSQPVVLHDQSDAEETQEPPR